MYDAGVERALVVALRAHEEQVRKSCGSPYIVHPLHVALMLAQLGQPSWVIQAGLLHDVVEDCDDWTQDGIREVFGPEVASLVAEVTEDKDRTWTERKQAAVDKVPGLSEGALVLKACDSLHNLESLARSLHEAADPAEVWACFTGGRDRTVEMAGKLIEALSQRLEGPLLASLRRVHGQIASA